MQYNIYKQFYRTGPNTFTSNLKEPIIRFATSDISGLCNVYFKDVNCVSQTKNIQINIVVPTSPYTIADNNWTNSLYGNNTFYSV